MAAPGREDELQGHEGCEPADDAATASRRMSTLRPIAMTCAAVVGALLSGLVAYVQGGAALTVFTFRLGRVGFFKNWMIATTYAGRSLVVLAIVVLVTAAVSAMVWTVGVLTWSKMVDRTSRVRVALDSVRGRLQSLISTHLMPKPDAR